MSIQGKMFFLLERVLCCGKFARMGRNENFEICGLGECEVREHELAERRKRFVVDGRRFERSRLCYTNLGKHSPYLLLRLLSIVHSLHSVAGDLSTTLQHNIKRTSCVRG